MKWVFIDLSYIAHRARCTTGNLTHEDIPTGVLYGFFQELYDICKNPPVSSNKIVIFADSKKSYRERAFPGYKKRRHDSRTPEEQKQIDIMHLQVDKLKNKIFPKLGFPIFKQVGLESDDLIAYAAEKLTWKKQKGIIITSDQDLYQCINPYVKWYDPGKKLLMDMESFEEKYNLIPATWGMVKGLGGCTSDCVPGLKGVGEKGAIKYLTGKLSKKYKQYRTIEKSTNEYKEWAELTVLPHKKTKSFEIYEPEYNIKMFFKFCKYYNIMSYLEPKRKKQWINFFKGKFKSKIRRRKRR
ncbi:MAG: hypothetical protein ACTSO3_01360 [Candidatus Heimdallarchaeaceae archaeon]